MYYAKKLWAAGGEFIYNFVPFVAPESFDDPQKYADFGCTVNLYEKLKIYRMTYLGADIAVEFSDEIESVNLSMSLPAGSTVEIFETVSGVETSVLRTIAGTHTFTSGSTKRYMIRRITVFTDFTFPIGSVWAYCFGIERLTGYIMPGNPYLKYVFFCENTLTQIGSFRNAAITGTLTINGGVTIIYEYGFFGCANLTKVITGDSVTAINGGNGSGAFMNCTSLEVADLGTGVTSIGTDTFRNCTSLVSIICRSYNPPTLAANAFNSIPATTNFYVPHERVNVYKAADGFVEFASRIYSINDL